MIGMTRKKMPAMESSPSDQSRPRLRNQFDAGSDIELPIMHFPSSCDESNHSIGRSILLAAASAVSKEKRLRKDRVNESTSGTPTKGFAYHDHHHHEDDDENADDCRPSRVPSLRGSMLEESASVVSSDSLTGRYGISSTRMLGYVICVLSVASLLLIASISNQNLLHPLSSSSSASIVSPEDMSQTISAAAAAAYSASHSAHSSNELNPISGDSESKTVVAESPCSKFIGSIEDGAFSFRVCVVPVSALFNRSSVHTCIFWSSVRLRVSPSSHMVGPQCSLRRAGTSRRELASHVTIRDVGV